MTLPVCCKRNIPQRHTTVNSPSRDPFIILFSHSTWDGRNQSHNPIYKQGQWRDVFCRLESKGNLLFNIPLAVLHLVYYAQFNSAPKGIPFQIITTFIAPCIMWHHPIQISATPLLCNEFLPVVQQQPDHLHTQHKVPIVSFSEKAFNALLFPSSPSSRQPTPRFTQEGYAPPPPPHTPLFKPANNSWIRKEFTPMTLCGRSEKNGHPAGL